MNTAFLNKIKKNGIFVLIIYITMSTSELKSNLYKLIDSINDSKTLQSIYTLISNKRVTETDFWDELSDKQKAEIEEAIAELDRGEGIPHEQVMKEFKAKYKI